MLGVGGSSPVMQDRLDGPAVVGGILDHAPQQRCLVHQLLGDAANVHTRAAKAPPGTWHVRKSMFRFIFRGRKALLFLYGCGYCKSPLSCRL